MTTFWIVFYLVGAVYAFGVTSAGYYRIEADFPSVSPTARSEFFGLLVIVSLFSWFGAFCAVIVNFAEGVRGLSILRPRYSFRPLWIKHEAYIMAEVEKRGDFARELYAEELNQLARYFSR